MSKCKCGKDHGPFYLNNISAAEMNVVGGEYDKALYSAHFGNHVFHMTSEELHSKSDIALELARRDLKIEELEFRLEGLEK